MWQASLGYLGGFFLFWRELKTSGREQEKGIDFFLFLSVAVLVGARLGFAAEQPEIFLADPGRVLLLIRYPGLSVIGGLGGALISLWVSKDFWRWGDMLALPGLFFGTFFWPHWPMGALFVFLTILKKHIMGSYAATKLFERPGFFALAFIMGLSLLNFPLVKSTNPWLYYSWVLVTTVAFGVMVARYQKLMNAVIKFPSQVLAQVKAYLEDRRKKTEKKIAELKKEDPFDDKDRLIDNAADDTEAHEKAGHERTQALTAQLNMILVQIRKALTKIKIGSYGICETCGKMIDTDRLVALPTAVLCVDCERKKEK